MTDSCTVGFIGFGNMGQAIAKGLVEAGTLDGSQIVACAAHWDKLVESTGAIGATALHDAKDVVDAADIIVVAIKPYQIETVIKPLVADLAGADKFVVSIAAGWTLDRFDTMMG